MSETENSNFVFKDRLSGEVIQENMYGNWFFQWAYTTKSGGWFNRVLFSQRWFTILMCRYYRMAVSKKSIPAYIEKYQIDMSESLKSADEFATFNDFFAREIDLSKRPIDEDPAVCVAPSDNRILVFPTVNSNTIFGVKRHQFHLKRFLGNDERLNNLFAGGSMAICRYYINDYHHFHFPATGIAKESVLINGKNYQLGPYDGDAPVHNFPENVRMITEIETDQFGTIGMIEIGAVGTASIHQEFEPNQTYAKGAHKGHFEMGASTVVLLFEPNKIVFDADLIEESAKNIETYMKFGTSIGKVAKPHS